MLKILLARFKQGHRTSRYPLEEPTLPDRFLGLPVLDSSRCEDGCRACVEACPTDAISLAGSPGSKLALDTGRCLFCNDCTSGCPTGAVGFSRDYRLASSTREQLVIRDGDTARTAIALQAKIRRLFGRSLKLRVVSAGGCNACESEVNVLGTVIFDLGRFGIQYVASPRHADGVFVTGVVTENMKLALQKTWEAIPAPKIVIAAGACAISGGPFAGHSESHDGAASVVPVDLFIPGCPPHPFTLLDGLLGMLDRLPEARLRGVRAGR